MPEKMECPFCGIVSGKIPSMKIYEDEGILAFLDINPRNPGHTLVVPKKHCGNLFDLSEEDAGEIFMVVRKVAEAVKAGTKADGISISQSNGRAAGQLVPHLHFHIIPRYLTEGPIGLEGVLPVKKFDQESMKKISEAIKKGMESAGSAIREEEETEEEESGAEEEEDDAFNF